MYLITIIRKLRGARDLKFVAGLIQKNVEDLFKALSLVEHLEVMTAIKTVRVTRAQSLERTYEIIRRNHSTE